MSENKNDNLNNHNDNYYHTITTGGCEISIMIIRFKCSKVHLVQKHITHIAEIYDLSSRLMCDQDKQDISHNLVYQAERELECGACTSNYFMYDGQSWFGTQVPTVV